MARSGTTMLRLLLDAHAELAIPSETGFGLMLTELGDRELDRDALVDRMTALPTWGDLAVSEAELRATFERVEPWSVGAGLRAYYAAYAARHGKARWGDKTPLHAEHMRPLAAALPEAFFLHLIRDGRDVAASLRGLPFAPGEGSLEEIAAAWCDTVDRARAAGAVLPRYHEIRYERLVAEPEPVLREVCALLQLPFDPAMLAAHERAAERLHEMSGIRAAGGVDGVEPERRRIFEHALGPPDARRAGRWREALTEDEVARVEAIAAPTLRSLGYPVAASEAAVVGAPAPLRVVIAAGALALPGGTESYAVTVARELQRLGHAPVLTAERLGPVAAAAERTGLPVGSADDLPDGCDAVLAHDAASTCALAARYPGARVVQVAHSDLFDHQLPVVEPGVVDAVVVLSDRIARRVAALPLDVPVVRLRHPVDTELYFALGPLRSPPRRALVVSNYLQGERRKALVEAWGAAGVECVQIGREGWTLDVVGAMSNVDIVVGKGRALLEGMSCARAAYVFDDFGGDGWVTPGTYAAIEADNVAGFATPAPRTPADLVADLDRYEPHMGWINRELIKAHHAARRHAQALVGVLRGPAAARRPPAATLDEIARLARCRWDAEQRAMHLQGEVVWMRDRTLEAEGRAAEAQAAAEAARRELASVRGLLETRRARAGLAAGRALDRVRRR